MSLTVHPPTSKRDAKQPLFIVAVSDTVKATPDFSIMSGSPQAIHPGAFNKHRVISRRKVRLSVEFDSGWSKQIMEAPKVWTLRQKCIFSTKLLW